MAPKTCSAKMAHTRNADLAKYRDKAGALSQHPSAADKLVRLIMQLLILALWRSVKALSVPFGKLFAVYFWMGKSAITLSMFLEKQLLKVVGWLSGTGFARTDSRLGRLSHFYFGMDIKRWHVGLVALVIGGVVTTLVRTIRNSFDANVKQSRLLRRLMASAKSYEEWRKTAEQLEKVDGEATRGVPPHEDYDKNLLLEKLRFLKRMRAAGVPREMMMALRIDLIRNVANIAKSQKRRQNFTSVPEPIHEYIKEVQEQLEQIAQWPETELPLGEKLSYFQVTRHAYGRTALLLSGGGGLGTFHLGVCKALFERNLLPRVLAGSSVGSIVCAVMGTHTDQELKKIFSTLKDFDIGFFQNSTVRDLARHMMNNGHMQSMTYMTDKLKTMLGECTFLEAHERTGRILNITVCPADTNEPSRLLNYMTAPQVMVWSAVAASSSFPGLYPPQNLHGRNSKGEPVVLHGKNGIDTMERRWRDGSLEFDLPVQTLGELFNCNHFLVSQTNPHIVPLVNFKSIFPHKWASIMEAELKHRLQVVQWMLPEWSMSRYLTLFTQPWEGDITFTLPSMLWNLSKTIVNPSARDLARAVEIGEHAAWERMVAIECNCTIEATLDKCSSQIKRKGGAQGMQSMAVIGGRLPSWLHMPNHHHGSVAGMCWGDAIADNDNDTMASWGNFQNLPEPNSPVHQRFSGYGGSSVTNGWHNDGLVGTAPESTSMDNHPPTGGTKLTAIPSGQLDSSIHSSDPDHEDGFDSASSVAAAPVVRPSAGGNPPASGLRRTDMQVANSTGISRRSSVMRNLNRMASQDHDTETPVPVPMSNGVNRGISRSSSVSGPTPASPQRTGRCSLDAGPAQVHTHTQQSGPKTGRAPNIPPRPHPTPDQAVFFSPGVIASGSGGLAHSRLALRSAASIGPGGDAASVRSSTPTVSSPSVTAPSRNGLLAGTAQHAPAQGCEADKGSDVGMEDLPPLRTARSVGETGVSSGLTGANLWGHLLPLANTFEAVEERKRAAAAAQAGSNGTSSPAPEEGSSGKPSVDVFAY